MRSLRHILLSLGAAALLSCTSTGSEAEDVEIISREAFIEVYVELRVQALRSPREELPVEERDRVLAGFGLRDQDLLTFVEARGRDVQFMRRVWEEIDSILTGMREVRQAPGSRGG